MILDWRWRCGFRIKMFWNLFSNLISQEIIFTRTKLKTCHICYCQFSNITMIITCIPKLLFLRSFQNKKTLTSNYCAFRGADWCVPLGFNFSYFKPTSTFNNTFGFQQTNLIWFFFTISIDNFRLTWNEVPQTTLRPYEWNGQFKRG